MKGLKRLYDELERRYTTLDDLAKRLQDDYNGDKEFEQDEQDRLDICFLLDLFDEIKELNKSAQEKELPSLTEMFLFEMWQQGITTLQELFECITDREQKALVKAVCSPEFIQLYSTESEQDIDEKGTNGLWDKAGEIAVAVGLYVKANPPQDGIVFANEWGQEIIYNALKEITGK